MTKITAPVRIDISPGWTDVDPYREEFGSYVLNGAIKLRVSVTVKKDKFSSCLNKVPRNSGLGSSSALRACYIVASNRDLYKDKNELIKRTFVLENTALSSTAGFQDESAAIYGGVNLWKFEKGDSNDAQIKRYGLLEEKADGLEKRIVLINTCEDHLASNILNLVFGNANYTKNIPRLHRMSQIAREMYENADDQEKIRSLIIESWNLQKGLHSSIETQKMRDLQERLKGNYLACRATGAGGGGCMIFYTSDKDRLIAEIKKIKKDFKIKPIPFEFDYKGIRVE